MRRVNADSHEVLEKERKRQGRMPAMWCKAGAKSWLRGTKQERRIQADVGTALATQRGPTGRKIEAQGPGRDGGEQPAEGGRSERASQSRLTCVTYPVTTRRDNST
jgi:hypothetical protein